MNVIEANFEAFVETEAITGKRRGNFKDPLLFGSKKHSTTTITTKTHSHNAQMIDLLIGRLLPRCSVMLQLAPSNVDLSVMRPGRVQAV